MEKRFPCLMICLCSLIFCCENSHGAMGAVLSDFEDNTLQGWTLSPASIGTLFVSANGNPGYCMAMTDDIPMGGGLSAIAPSQFYGDLSVYGGIQWDEFVPDRGSITTSRTSITIWSGIDSRYILDYNPAQFPVGIWNTRFASFDPSSWALDIGTLTFEEVIQNVTQINLRMETSTTSGVIESYVDNIALVPEPTSICLLGLGLLGLLHKKR